MRTLLKWKSFVKEKYQNYFSIDNSDLSIAKPLDVNSNEIIKTLDTIIHQTKKKLNGSALKNETMCSNYQGE